MNIYPYDNEEHFINLLLRFSSVRMCNAAVSTQDTKGSAAQISEGKK